VQGGGGLLGWCTTSESVSNIVGGVLEGMGMNGVMYPKSAYRLFVRIPTKHEEIGVQVSVKGGKCGE